MQQSSPDLEPGAAPEARPASSILDDVDAPVEATAVTLASGRRYEMETGGDADRVTIRSRAGEIVLRIEVTDAGPVLSFSGASVELSATRRLRLAAEEMSIAATRDLSLAAGCSLRERIDGDHHTVVAGDERLEAANVQMQASRGGVGVRAMERIALDGEHIGLNDDLAPLPFAWSEIAEGPAEG